MSHKLHNICHCDSFCSFLKLMQENKDKILKKNLKVKYIKINSSYKLQCVDRDSRNCF